MRAALTRVGDEVAASRGGGPTLRLHLGLILGRDELSIFQPRRDRAASLSMTHLLVALVLPHAFVLPPKVARAPAVSQKCAAVSMNAAMGGGGDERKFLARVNGHSPRMQQTAEAKANPKPAAYNTNWWPNQLRVDLLSGVSVRRAILRRNSARLAAQIPDAKPGRRAA